VHLKINTQRYTLRLRFDILKEIRIKRGGSKMYDFVTAAIPWVMMGLGVAIVCANEDKFNIYWEKWCKALDDDSKK